MKQHTSQEIRTKRLELNLSQGRLSRLSGVSSFLIGQYENRKQELSDSQIIAIEAVLFAQSTSPAVQPQNQDQLILKNTPNDLSGKRFCWNERPCYRELECEYCWNRKRKFLLEQFEFYGQHWGLCNFITIPFIKLGLEPEPAIRLLGKIRKQLHKRFPKGQKIISLIALHGDLKTPHFHIVATEKINKEFVEIILKRTLKKFDERIKGRIHVKAISDLYGLGWYFVVDNLRPTLIHRPRGFRLMSASRPFLTGKPKKIKHIQEWSKSNEK